MRTTLFPLSSVGWQGQLLVLSVIESVSAVVSKPTARGRRR
jgi:hypothetical protein